MPTESSSADESELAAEKLPSFESIGLYLNGVSAGSHEQSDTQHRRTPIIQIMKACPLPIDTHGA
jgi:hypothetical protein